MPIVSDPTKEADRGNSLGLAAPITSCHSVRQISGATRYEHCDNPRRCLPSAALGFCKRSNLASAFPSFLPCQLSPLDSRLKPTSVT